MTTPTGEGTKPDLLAVAGDNAPILPPRPVRARANDAAKDTGIVAEGNCTGDEDTERDIPWL